MKQNILRIVLLSVLLGLLLFMFSAVSTPPSAHAASMIPAGSNGQELYVTTRGYWGCVDYGTNNYGTRLTNKCFYLPYYRTFITGWWWKGAMSFTVYDAQWHWLAGSCYNIPVSQPWDNFNITLAP